MTFRNLWWWVIMCAFLWGILDWITAWWGAVDVNGHEQFASIAIISSFLIAVITVFVRQVKHWYYRKTLFKAWLPEAWPVLETPKKLPTSKELGSSTTELLIRIVPRYSGKLDNFDMRFLKGKGVNEDPNIIHITKVFNQLRGRDFVNPSQTGLIDRLDFYAIKRDGIGGIDCYYSTPISLDKNRTIYFNIQFEASKPWQGYLSFRGRDKNGNFVNPTDVGVKINLPPTPDIEGSPSPTDE